MQRCLPLLPAQPTAAARPAGKSMHDIPKDTLEDACQLVKANSIQVGSRLRCKAASVQKDRCTH